MSIVYLLIQLLLLVLLVDPQVQAQGIHIITINPALNFPLGVALDRSNNVYVADYFNNRIVQLSPNGTFISNLTTSNPALSHPGGVAVDTSYNVYVTDFSNNRIVKFASNGTILSVWTTSNPALSSPYEVAVDPSNNVYVSDSGNNRIVIFAPNGTILSFLTTTNFSRGAAGVAVDPSYNVYAADALGNRIVKFAPNGTLLAVLTTINPPLAPFGVAVDSSYNVYVADIGNQRIVKFAPNGTVIAVLTTTNPSLLRADGVAVDNNSNVYVGDGGNNRVVIFYFQLCPLGYYCTGLNSTATLCPAGSYCPLQYLYAPNVTVCPVGFSCPPGTYTLSSPTAGILGDPQFIGLLGQRYQVHGLDGEVYNLITDDAFQMNSRFRFLADPGECPIMPSTRSPAKACWSHPGSYLTEIGIQILTTNRTLKQVHIKSGTAKGGFTSINHNGRELDLSVRSRMDLEGLKIRVISTHEVEITVEKFILEVENIDQFVNLRAIKPRQGLETLESHGLIGQTWNPIRYEGGNPEIEGQIDDYLIWEKDVFGVNFVYNRFKS